MGYSLFRFLIYSNLFMACCAVLMVNHAAGILLQQPPDPAFAGFVFFSTLCSYSFHWYLSFHSVLPSERIQWLSRYRYIHVLLFIAGLAGAGWYFVRLLPHWEWLLGAAFATFLYSAPKIPHPLFRALRRVAIGKTIFLALTWMYVTSVLPVIVAGEAWNSGFTIFAISRFFFIYSICILFDYRDRADDKADGVRSLITFLGEKSIRLLFFSSLFLFLLFTVLLLKFGYPVLTVILLLVPGGIVGLLYNYARRNFSDWLYYFVLDGLMALPALLMLVAGI